MFDLCPLIMTIEEIEDICGDTKKEGKGQRRGAQMERSRLILTPQVFTY